jgi:hypothetical protein
MSVAPALAHRRGFFAAPFFTGRVVRVCVFRRTAFSFRDPKSGGIFGANLTDVNVITASTKKFKAGTLRNHFKSV